MSSFAVASVLVWGGLIFGLGLLFAVLRGLGDGIEVAGRLLGWVAGAGMVYLIVRYLVSLMIPHLPL